MGGQAPFDRQATFDRYSDENSETASYASTMMGDKTGTLDALPRVLNASLLSLRSLGLVAGFCAACAVGYMIMLVAVIGVRGR